MQLDRPTRLFQFSSKVPAHDKLLLCLLNPVEHAGVISPLTHNSFFPSLAGCTNWRGVSTSSLSAVIRPGMKVTRGASSHWCLNVDNLRGNVTQYYGSSHPEFPDTVHVNWTLQDVGLSFDYMHTFDGTYNFVCRLNRTSGSESFWCCRGAIIECILKDRSTTDEVLKRQINSVAQV